MSSHRKFLYINLAEQSALILALFLLSWFYTPMMARENCQHNTQSVITINKISNDANHHEVCTSSCCYQNIKNDKRIVRNSIVRICEKLDKSCHCLHKSLPSAPSSLLPVSAPEVQPLAGNHQIASVGYQHINTAYSLEKHSDIKKPAAPRYLLISCLII
jgi:hypothetical protein